MTLSFLGLQNTLNKILTYSYLLKKCIYLNQGFKFCLFILIFSIIILSIFADKQPHYLTPLMPIVGLIFSYIFSTSLNININKINFIPIYLTLIFYFICSYLLLFNQEILGINQNLKTPEIILLLIVPIISLIFSIFILFYKNNLLSNFIYIMTFQSIFLIFFIHIIFNIFLYNFYDLKDFSIKIDNLNNSNFKVAYVGKYHGQFNFLGRLEKPISVIEGGNVKEWFNINPNSYIVYNHRNMPSNEGIKPFYSQKFRGRTLSIWQKNQVINHLGIFTK